MITLKVAPCVYVLYSFKVVQVWSGVMEADPRIARARLQHALRGKLAMSVLRP